MLRNYALLYFNVVLNLSYLVPIPPSKICNFHLSSYLYPCITSFQWDGTATGMNTTVPKQCADRCPKKVHGEGPGFISTEIKSALRAS